MDRIQFGDKVIVDSNRHPLYHHKGKVVGIRGQIEEGNNWILVYFPNRADSKLIPENYLKKTP
jgi:hypothetical protein